MGITKTDGCSFIIMLGGIYGCNSSKLSSNLVGKSFKANNIDVPFHFILEFISLVSRRHGKLGLRERMLHINPATISCSNKN